MNNLLSCFECVQSEVYHTLEDLEAHIASDHLNICPYECEKCKYAKFPTEFTLVSHCLNDHGMVEFSIKYRYTPELREKKKELAQKLQQCISMSRNLNVPGKLNDPVSSTVEHRVKVEHPESISQQSSSPLTFMEMEATVMNSYHAFLVPDETLTRHEEERAGPSSVGMSNTSISTINGGGDGGGGPMRAKVNLQIQCVLCGDHVSKQRSSMVYHANTRHGKYELYECGICHRKWQTIAKSDVIKHIKSHHELPDGTINMDMVLDYRKNLGNKLKEITEKCFPERKKKRIGYTDVDD